MLLCCNKQASSQCMLQCVVVWQEVEGLFVCVQVVGCQRWSATMCVT